MIQYKNKALDDLYNRRSKQPTKNFKTKDTQDYVPRPEPAEPTNIIPKPIPRIIPEAPPIKNIIPKPAPINIPDTPPQIKDIGKDQYIYI